MPSVPMEIPSLTPIVLKRMPTSPAALTPSLTFAARSLRCILQVLPSHQTLEIPTSAFCMSAGSRPVPYNMAWDAPWERGSVIRELNRFSFSAIFYLEILGYTNGTGHCTDHRGTLQCTFPVTVFYSASCHTRDSAR